MPADISKLSFGGLLILYLIQDQSHAATNTTFSSIHAANIFFLLLLGGLIDKPMLLRMSTLSTTDIVVVTLYCKYNVTLLYCMFQQGQTQSCFFV